MAASTSACAAWCDPRPFASFATSTRPVITLPWQDREQFQKNDAMLRNLMEPLQ
jgi:hypothetical protein